MEPVFGQINQGRGFLQFLLRHLEKVNGEWSLICTVRDLLKLFRFVRPVVNSFQSAIQMPRPTRQTILRLRQIPNPRTNS